MVLIRIAHALSALPLATLGLAQISCGLPCSENDLATLLSEATALDHAVEAFPGSGLLGALTIHNDTITLTSTLNNATADLEAAGSLSEADCDTILSGVNAFEPIILDILQGLMVKEPNFAALPTTGIPALILGDLETICPVNDAFINELMDVCPSLSAELGQLLRTLMTACGSTIMAFSG